MTLFLEPSWQGVVGNELQQPYFSDLMQFIEKRATAGVNIYPPAKHWFSALNSTPFSDVKVVILGQDPYHGEGQAHGLCFSVQPSVKIPPSLRNIYKELHTDLSVEIPEHGYLQAWAEQGVLLLNNVLTVEEGAAGSHQGKGWELFTDAVVQQLNQGRENLVFLLWGSHAQKKGVAINRQRHLVLEATHPSPLSAYRGFFGCQHFSKANAYLASHGKAGINWQL
ncbi:Uracil-DNA glycosylase [Zhongshania aliphaticivorans]|uniref:Uracil-DNA glycosylase n=1 Tax=Zhongshania aliphaticivorans TaxID=1470434 RepID=A0A5S9QB76_9GAMM|nr:uracil-DNA glycosylase [Zhongshania aliphaticivorans]CAA0087278.1 Uracil-DNA glycosylase [Zhongshania aliphaticivorans]CAA0114461.1 Uracil-DNA glycosylase [Zhongshania aliphaticivorans]